MPTKRWPGVLLTCSYAIAKTNSDTCNPDLNLGSSNPEAGYWAYHTAVHEAGHALGMSGINDFILRQRYHAAHPTIPGSVMNYDIPGDIRHPSVSDDFAEPDCSPHPFDVMAMFALYQSVPKLTVTGTTEALGGETVSLVAEGPGQCAGAGEWIGVYRVTLTVGLTRAAFSRTLRTRTPLPWI